MSNPPLQNPPKDIVSEKIKRGFFQKNKCSKKIKRCFICKQEVIGKINVTRRTAPPKQSKLASTFGKHPDPAKWDSYF
jgi:hypothetical protein